MRTILFSLFLFCCTAMGAQNLEFTMVKRSDVNIRKAPSTSAAKLMYVGHAPTNEYRWSSNLPQGVDNEPFHLMKYEAAQVIGHVKGWTKVRFRLDHGEVSHVAATAGTRTVEGWMSDRYLMKAEPLHITWENFPEVMSRGFETMIDRGEMKKTIFMADIYYGVKWIQHAQIANGCLVVYGNDEALTLEQGEAKDGNLKFVKHGEGYQAIYPASYCNPDHDYLPLVSKCTEAEVDQIYGYLNKKEAYHRYYFRAPDRLTFCTLDPQSGR